jgi:uncharacterized protein YkwD
MLKKWLKIYKKKLSSSRLFLFLQQFKKNRKNLKNNFQDFKKEEKREVSELLSGKQSWQKYFHDASKLFKDYFIPSDSNDNRPKILRPKQLVIIAVLLLILKVSLVGYIFSVYQEKAEMSTSITSQVFILTNEARVSAGVPALELDPYLSQAAQLKAEDMIINNYFSHTSLDGRKPWNFVNRNLYPYLLVGENLAMNFITASDVQAALMASPSHRKNILNEKYTDVGLYVTNGEIDGRETNILVEIFAYQKESEEPVSEVVAESDTKEETVLIETNNNQTEVISLEDNNKTENMEPEVLSINEETPSQESADSEIENGDVTSKDSSVLGNEQEATFQDIEKVDIDSLTTTSVVEEESLIKATTSTSTLEIESLDVSSVMSQIPEEDDKADRSVVVASSYDKQINQAAKTIAFSKLVYVLLLAFLIIALLINIIVRYRVQHKSVIMQTVLLLILIIALLFFDFSFISRLKNAAGNIILF